LINRLSKEGWHKQLLMIRTKTGSLWDIFLNSYSAFILIVANFFTFAALNAIYGPRVVPTSLIVTPEQLFSGNYTCLITAGFIHSSLSHLSLNMLGVFIFARIVEKHFGITKTLFIYFGALILSMLFAGLYYGWVQDRNVAIVGSSGALMGLIGCAMLVDPFWITYETFLPLPVMAKGWLFIFADLKGFLGGEKGGVSHLAHLFGFFSVVILVYFLNKKEQKKMFSGLMINLFCLITFLIAYAWFNRPETIP